MSEFKFNVKEQKIIINEYVKVFKEDGKDYDYKSVDKSVDGFITPCGLEIPKLGNVTVELTKEDIIQAHCEGKSRDNYYDHNTVKKGCIECKVASGLSKAKIMPSQDNVAHLFGIGIDGLTSSSGNFHSENGLLIHYSTIESIRTKQGIVIDNNECWSGGYAHCSTPRNVKYHLDLTSLEEWFSRDALRDIVVLDHDKDYDTNLGTLFTIGERYFINASNKDGRGRFLAELIKPCQTLKEAYESMKPKQVKLAESQGLEVKRQGELFFIPLHNETTLLQNNIDYIVPKVTDIQQRHKKPIKIYYGQCSKCGIKTATSKNKDSWELTNHPTFRYMGYSELSHHKNKKIQKAIDCNEKYDRDNDKFMKVKSKEAYEFTPYPTIDIEPNPTEADQPRVRRLIQEVRHGHHTATRVGKIGQTIVAKGIVRHQNGDHHKLELSNIWHVVVRNTVKASMSSGDRRGHGWGRMSGGD